jgi:hypothetical protein
MYKEREEREKYIIKMGKIGLYILGFLFAVGVLNFTLKLFL